MPAKQERRPQEMQHVQDLHRLPVDGRVRMRGHPQEHHRQADHQDDETQDLKDPGGDQQAVAVGNEDGVVDLRPAARLAVEFEDAAAHEAAAEVRHGLEDNAAVGLFEDLDRAQRGGAMLGQVAGRLGGQRRRRPSTSAEPRTVTCPAVSMISSSSSHDDDAAA